ncbi:ATP-binding cassette domain-containing protein [Luedemannella flava]
MSPSGTAGTPNRCCATSISSYPRATIWPSSGPAASASRPWRVSCGLLRPSSGAVLIGGAVAGELPADRLAGLRALIPQEAYVFTGTVRENLAYLRPCASDGQVLAAARAVGAAALVERLGGLDGPVTPGALSAGERQLIALVRAYLSDAPVAVLDEATCHLDPAAERRAEEAFAARGGTLVVIAHRLSSALRARRVLALDGARAELYDQSAGDIAPPGSLYRELLDRWGSDPAGVARDADRLDPGPAAGLGHGPREVVADRARA